MELYCIKHEKMFHTEQGVCGLGHVDIVPVSGGVGGWTRTTFDLNFCRFPLGYAFCAPPEVGGWLERVGEPSVEDLQYELDLEFEPLEV